VSDLENSTTIRIGDLLERAGLVTSADLTEAVSVSKRLQLPIGRVLIMSGCVTERILKSAIEAQSLIRDKGVNLGKALETLVKVAEEDISFQDALRKTDPARVPGSHTNRLGEILIEFGLIDEQQLQDALVLSGETGMQLGATLVSMDLLSPMLLPLLLRTQEQIREGIITRQQAAQEFKSSYAMWTKAEESFLGTGSGTHLQTQYAQAMQQRVQDPHEAFFKQFGHPPSQPSPAQYQPPMPPPNPYGYPPGYPPLPPGYPYPVNQQGYPYNPHFPYPQQYAPGSWPGVDPDGMAQAPPPNPYNMPPPQWPTQFQHPNSQVPQPTPQIQPAGGGYPPANPSPPQPPAPPQHQAPQQHQAPPPQTPGVPGGQPHQQQWQAQEPTPAPAPVPQQPPASPHPSSRTANTRLPALNPNALPSQAPPPSLETPQPAAPTAPAAPTFAEYQAPAPIQTQAPQVQQPSVPAFERVISRKLKSQTVEAPSSEVAPAEISKPRRRTGSRPAVDEEAAAPKNTGEVTVRLTGTEIEQFLEIVDHTPAANPASSSPEPTIESDEIIASWPEDGLAETIQAIAESVELNLDESPPLSQTVKTEEIDQVPSSQYRITPTAEVETVIDYDAVPHSAPEATIETTEIYESAIPDPVDVREEDTLIDYEPTPSKAVALQPTAPIAETPADNQTETKTVELDLVIDDALESEIDTLIDYEPDRAKASQNKPPEPEIVNEIVTQQLEVVNEIVTQQLEPTVVPQSDLTDLKSQDGPKNQPDSSEEAELFAELAAVQEELESALDFTPRESTSFSSFEFDFPTPAFAQASPDKSDKTSEPDNKTNQQSSLGSNASEDTPTVSELPVINFRLGNSLMEFPEDVTSEASKDSPEAAADQPTSEATTDAPKSETSQGSDLLGLFTKVINSKDVRRHSRLTPLTSKSWGNGHEKPSNGFEKLDKKRSKSKSGRSKPTVQDSGDVAATHGNLRVATELMEIDSETRKLKGNEKTKERKKGAKRKREEEVAQPLVEILKSAGYFNDKELNDAFAAALINTSALPELLSVLGLVGDDTLASVRRCQAMLTSGDLKSKQAILLLEAIKGGKTFDQAMDDLHFTSTANI
jgi:hypothetical protein